MQKNQTSSDLEWAEAMRQNAQAIATRFDIAPQMIGGVRALAGINLVCELKSSTDARNWLYSIKMYNRLRYTFHLAKMPPPSRKLRKCQMRKIFMYRKQARRRYGV